MTDSVFDNSQVDNANIEIMMISRQIKPLLTCEQRLLVVSGFSQFSLFFFLIYIDSER